jgi:hypothetical protein
MSHPHALTGLTEREAITDALYRAIISCDRNDASMLDTAFSSNPTVTIAGGPSITGLDALRAQLLDFVGPKDTQHIISNVRVDIKDSTTASLTCYALAQHAPPGQGPDPDGPKLMAGGEYFMDLVKDEEDGLWKIEKWELKVIWRQGDRSVMQRPGQEIPKEE